MQRQETESPTEQPAAAILQPETEAPTAPLATNTTPPSSAAFPGYPTPPLDAATSILSSTSSASLTPSVSTPTQAATTPRVVTLHHLEQDEIVKQLVAYLRCQIEVGGVPGAITAGTNENGIEKMHDFKETLKKLDDAHIQLLGDYIEGRTTYPGYFSWSSVKNPLTGVLAMWILTAPAAWLPYTYGAILLGGHQWIHRLDVKRRCDSVLIDIKKVMPHYVATPFPEKSTTASIASFVGGLFKRNATTATAATPTTANTAVVTGNVTTNVDASTNDTSETPSSTAPTLGGKSKQD